MAVNSMKAAALTGASALRKGFALRPAMVGLCCLALAACATVSRNHGYVPAEAELAQVQIGKDNRETVAQKIGRPSAQGVLNDEGWFYVQSRFEHVGPREPVEVDRQVVAVTFNQAGTVSNIGRYGLEDGRVVEISRRITETNIQGIGFVRQLLSNFGRIQASDLFKD